MGQKSRLKQQRRLEREREAQEQVKRKKRGRIKLASFSLIVLLSMASIIAMAWTDASSRSQVADGSSIDLVPVNRTSPPPNYSRTGNIDDEPVTPQTWRSIKLEMHKEDGTKIEIGLLRPLWWLEDAGAEVGGTIDLAIPEFGVEGIAQVLSIGPCKADSRGGTPGTRVVTGKFAHEGAIVWDLYFNNKSENKLGVTDNHPLWSETRNGWVEAGHLEIGEYVRTMHGVAKLTSREQRPGRHKVYNLEVHKDHTYYVSNLGILAHNSCAIPGRPFRGQNAPQQAYKHLDQHHGVSPQVARNRLHKIKEDAGLKANDDVAIGRTGDVYDERTGERIGSLTDNDLGTER